MAGAVGQLVGTVVGLFLVLFGFTRLGIALTPGGMIAGLLMIFAGLVLAPHGRLAIEGFTGPMESRDAASLFVLALLGSFGLNLVTP